MERLYKIKKGLDINLVGEAEPKLKSLALSSIYTIRPDDFHGIVPRPVVKEGDHVQAGSPLFVDKATEQIAVVSPVSGIVKSLTRGDRRKLLGISIDADKHQEYKDFGRIDLAESDAADIRAKFMQSGLFAMIRRRPYDIIAQPTDEPKAIFISTFSRMPLAADFSFVVNGNEELFKTGIKVLAKIAKVYLGIAPEQINTDLLPCNEAEVCVFSGPNPAGNVGVHINRVDPINKGEVVWTIDPETVVMIGRLAEGGKTVLTRRIAVAGSKITAPQYIEAKIGTPIADILNGLLTDPNAAHTRIINGNPLVGEKSTMNDSLHAFSREICAIPEGDDVNEVLGWIMPRTNEFSTSRSYFSWLFGRSKKYNPDCRIKGGERHIIMSGEYDRVFPMNIFAGYLIKAIITGDIDRQEALGIYEVAPEDFAVAEFVDSSKLELQRIVREGLDILRKENA